MAVANVLFVDLIRNFITGFEIPSRMVPAQPELQVCQFSFLSEHVKWTN